MSRPVQIMESYGRLLVPAIFTVLCVSLLPSVHGQAIGRQVSPFLFQLDESAVDGKLYSYLTGPGPAAIIKQNETKSLPIIILSATAKPILVKFHVTAGNNQTGSIQMPLGVHATVEPSEITVKSNQNQTINIIVGADKNAPDGKYALNIVGEWPEENGFVGTSIVINIGKDFGPDAIPFNFQWTPLKQFKSGIPRDEIKCKEDLQLVIKSSNWNPACVKPETKAKLFERGWATSVNLGAESSRHCSLVPDPGICKAAIEKYYFDWKTNSCKPFTWGGCGGTVPFDTVEFCQLLCS